ncbi:putative sterigmatocystin biosynthesis P450 monooxygenase STCB [Colletotrichum orbiculare MAFF 240422]|uniref:Sterigmatocystin biosynthesis P450 monooxygenase STCB n=1 Tax=Colletotrichum orbiculare (strain 104-T / ATCC 96160 / CBS 514.97 / LARS 414 / MAFF 240422) TaxID=1213857 RepID=A0A484FI83_COLOR|nr:putative sterigmatocystin biosynthesis P450 monooxygenase STCB [Colletotrichum orbiculare MAFF 240422]
MIVPSLKQVLTTTALTYTSIALLTIAVLYLLRKTSTSPLRHVPGPFYTLFTRYPLKYHVLAGRRIFFVHDLHSRYGPVVRISPTEVALSDPDSFAAIHRIGGGFLKSPWYDLSTLYDGSESPVFSLLDPKKHAERRKLFARVFAKQSLRREWERDVREKAERAVNQVERDLRRTGRADVYKWSTMLATDVIAHLAFGESFNMLEVGEKNDYIKMLELVSVQNTIRYELPLLHHLLARLPFRSAPDAQAVLKSYGRRAVSKLRRHGTGTGTAARSLFSGVLEASDAGDKTWLTEPVVEAEAKSMIVGGSDTTSVTLTYLIWAVVQRPELRARVEEEVAALGPGFDDAVLEKLPLLNAVIDETLRLYGAVPGHLGRVVPPKGATLGGYFIPGGVGVETQAYTLHRDPQVWPDPYRFDETRFLDPHALTPVQKLLFSPFGAGSRICLGIELARMELRLAAAVLFRRCRGLRSAPDMTDDVMEMENFFMIAPRGHRCDVVLA